ncbi:hypothetical protein OPKNFCMD_3656 [Methylobacterium crusticola]|uniref:DUF2188 domain-containing protein n=1 Tax=Methylobacterium crusticola TaxID=1697972 RepID=A0ABQ4QZR2_9HYPH|nr:hypothetical protein [Methylobacterium crusticola]GJD50907.1 hypothetical protein OPKNFCMD_3656 [Methylobacterium crusticola]
MPEIRVVGTEDGTYTVYRGTEVVAAGLTHSQADAVAAELGAAGRAP